MESKGHTLPEAARIAGVSEDELRCAIKDGFLLAERLQNTGEYHIQPQDLLAYIRQTRKGTDPGVSKGRRRVLIIDDEINYANILKLELERDPRIEAKFATWGRDGIRVAEKFLPEVCLVDFMLPDIRGDEVLGEMRKLRELHQTKMIVYSAHTREAIRENPNLEQRLQDLGADEFLSKSGGMRQLIIRVYSLLGIESPTKILRKP